MDVGEYWIVLQPSVSDELAVEGPFTKAEADAYRAEWLREFPEFHKIGDVFPADGREHAERIAMGF